ncbi:HemK methyltransferase member 2 [Irineochytrium annulatum]|nr:HemK methyltransferase member 2 [Irineochytrium annulatum]
MATPAYSHLKAEDFRDVYEPAEDTFLMLDALESDEKALKALNPTICMEIGKPSGVNEALYLATDINEKAALASFRTGTENGVRLDCVRTKFALHLGTRLRGAVDVLIFNPPYVVTSSEEVGSTGIEAAWAGGIDGREVLDEFLPHVSVLTIVKELLSDNGTFYLVTIRENRPLEIMETMKRLYSMDSKVVLSRKAGIEGLSVLKFWKA